MTLIHLAARVVAEAARLLAVAAQAVADATASTPDVVPVEWVAEWWTAE